MARIPKNPNVERVAHIPFDKDRVSPMPQSARRARGVSAGPRSTASETPAPATERPRPRAREEYPGPQIASSGTNVEPGRVRPAKRGDR
jgi:hypothetical protein